MDCGLHFSPSKFLCLEKARNWHLGPLGISCTITGLMSLRQWIVLANLILFHEDQCDGQAEECFHSELRKSLGNVLCLKHGPDSLTLSPKDHCDLVWIIFSSLAPIKLQQWVYTSFPLFTTLFTLILPFSSQKSPPIVRFCLNHMFFIGPSLMLLARTHLNSSSSSLLTSVLVPIKFCLVSAICGWICFAHLNVIPWAEQIVPYLSFYPALHSKNGTQPKIQYMFVKLQLIELRLVSMSPDI